jgi:hypothetical protein
MIFNRIGGSFKGKLDGDPYQTELKIMITHILRQLPVIYVGHALGFT